MQSDPGRGKATDFFPSQNRAAFVSFIEVKQPQALDIRLHISVHSTRHWG